jgi:hypothetical protein
MNRAERPLFCRASEQKCQPAYKPGYVWRLISARWPFLWDGRCRPPRATNPGESPETGLGALPRPSPLFGLAPGGACHAADVTARAVRSYRTLSPLPTRLAAPRRFAFCGAFPEVTLAGRYPAPCLHGARTFLCFRSGHPAGWQERLRTVREAGQILAAIVTSA